MGTTTMSGEWNNSFFSCCSVKGCCCSNFLCPCMPMVWASAMTQIKGKDYSYLTCCLAAQCCPICTFGWMGKELTNHYQLEDKDCCCPYPIKGCLPLLSFYQIVDHIMVKESLHMTFGGIAPDEGGAAPGGA